MKFTKWMVMGSGGVILALLSVALISPKTVHALYIAKTSVRAGYDLSECISDGNLALIEAVDGFDFARGNRFSTYATWAIRNAPWRTHGDSSVAAVTTTASLTNRWRRRTPASTS